MNGNIMVYTPGLAVGIRLMLIVEEFIRGYLNLCLFTKIQRFVGKGMVLILWIQLVQIWRENVLIGIKNVGLER